MPGQRIVNLLAAQPKRPRPPPPPQLRTPVRHPLNNQQISHLRLVTIHGPLGGQRTQVSPWRPACPPVHFAPRPGRAGRREGSSDVTTGTDGAGFRPAWSAGRSTPDKTVCWHSRDCLTCLPRTGCSPRTEDRNRGETLRASLHPSPAMRFHYPLITPSFRRRPSTVFPLPPDYLMVHSPSASRKARNHAFDRLGHVFRPTGLSRPVPRPPMGHDRPF